MKKTRREFLLSTAILPFVVSSWPKLALRPEAPSTVASILAVSFKAARQEILRDGWSWPELQEMQRRDVLSFAHLGAQVEWAGVNPDGSSNGLSPTTNAQQISTPLAWTEKDNVEGDEDTKARLVSSLCENGIWCHDMALHEAVEGCRRCVISTQYHHDLGEIYHIKDLGYVTKIYTAFSVLRCN